MRRRSVSHLHRRHAVVLHVQVLGGLLRQVEDAAENVGELESQKAHVVLTREPEDVLLGRAGEVADAAGDGEDGVVHRGVTADDHDRDRPPTRDRLTPRGRGRLVPDDDRYEHEATWNDDNGHSHVRAAFIAVEDRRFRVPADVLELTGRD